MKRILGVIVLLAAFQSAAYAGLDEGLAAAKAGKYEEAMKEWKPMAEKGSRAAQTNVARLYEVGAGVPQDYVQAAFWYRKAAEQGLANAQADLATFYILGQGVKRDIVLAYMLFELAEKGGDTEATSQLENLALSMNATQLREARNLAAAWKTNTPLPTTSETGQVIVAPAKP